MAASKKLKTIIFTNPDGSISEAILFPGFGGNGVAEVAARSDHSHTADNVAETAFKLWLTPTLQAAFNDKYTKLEIDNLISGIVHNMDWKESVDTYADIATTYPTPDDGWTVNARLEDGGNGKTYRYSAAKAAWVDVTGGIVPMATALQDGKLSKEDFIKLQGLVSFPGFAGSGIAETASRSDHGHSAAQVTFSDSKTLQQKFDEGSLKGTDGYTPIVGENSNWWVNGVDTGKKAIGADGKKILMQKNTIASTIEWQYEGDLVWQTLCAFADIQGPKGDNAYVTVNNLLPATANTLEESQLAYYPTGKMYGSSIKKYFSVCTINGIKKFLPLDLTYIATDLEGINVFDPVTEQYIQLRSWESLTGFIDIFQNVEIFDSSKNNNPLTITVKSTTTIYKEKQETAWSGNLTIAFVLKEPTKAIGKCVTFELHLYQGNNRSWTFPTNVSWYRGLPNITLQTNWIALVFRTFDGGATWVGDLSYYY